MKYIDVEQGTEEWFKARCGHPTASCFDKIVDINGNPSKQREGYLYQLAGERITKKPEETYQSDIMKRAKELEDEARQVYGLAKKVKVQKVGLFLTEGRCVYGASPDGAVGKDGLLEIKCPIMKTHIGYMFKGKFPMDYWQQTQGQLLVTGRKWVDFVSYYPGIMPFIVRVKPHKEFLGKLLGELYAFGDELNKITRRIK